MLDFLYNTTLRLLYGEFSFMNIQAVSFNDLTLLDVHDPKEAEMHQLVQEYNIQQQDLDEYIERKQIPTIEHKKHYSLIVLDFAFYEPIKEKQSHEAQSDDHHKHKKYLPKPPMPNIPMLAKSSEKRKIRTGRVNFFLSEKSLIILHDNKTPQIDDVFAACQQTLDTREFSMTRGPLYLLQHFLDALVQSSLSIAGEIANTIDAIDKEVIENRAAKTVEDISIGRRNIVVFHTMVKTNLMLFRSIEKGEHTQLENGSLYQWKELTGFLQKTLDRLEDSRELLEGIARSHESLLTARTNEIMKVLTMFTAILFPLTLLVSIYGMNIVGLPFAEEPYGLLILLEIMVVMAASMFAIFKFKGWL